MLTKGLILLLLLASAGLGFWLSDWPRSPWSFTRLDSEQMRRRITAERDLAIEKAVAEGKYRCCVEPPCTMCFLEANQWNNSQAGTCACDELIAQGQEPCPQCQNRGCGQTGSAGCQVKSSPGVSLKDDNGQNQQSAE